MELTQEIKQVIENHAIKEYPKECCGIIVDGKAIECENISETPLKSFIVKPSVIRAYGLENITGFYHSHPEPGDFSVADIAFCEKLNKTCILYLCQSKEFKIYNAKGMKIPYEGRPFFLGTLDCLSLFKDYYQRELNLIFDNDIEHPERFNYKAWSTPEFTEKYGYVTVVYDYLIKNGFVEVHSLQKHDIILMRLAHINFPVHIVIYLGNNQILQHMGEFSKVESYLSQYQRLATNILRHNSQM